jgi:hypothetical protein
MTRYPTMSTNSKPVVQLRNQLLNLGQPYKFSVGIPHNIRLVDIRVKININKTVTIHIILKTVHNLSKTKVTLSSLLIKVMV